MGNPYPANFETPAGAGRLTGKINFTDPANQPGGGGYAAGSDRITVVIFNLPVPHASTISPVDWSFGTPYVATVGTALALVGPNIVFVENGCYATQVHLPHGVEDGGTFLSVEASLALTCGAALADGDDDSCPAGLARGALSCAWTWTQDAGSALEARITVPGAVDGVVESCVAQIVKLSDVPETP